MLSAIAVGSVESVDVELSKVVAVRLAYSLRVMRTEVMPAAFCGFIQLSVTAMPSLVGAVAVTVPLIAGGKYWRFDGADVRPSVIVVPVYKGVTVKV